MEERYTDVALPANGPEEEYDEVDSARLSRQNPVMKRPPKFTAQLHPDDFYRMDNPRRGDCIIFSYSDFKRRSMNRDCSKQDAQLCEEAFKKLGFEVQIHSNLKEANFKKVLKQASERDYSDCDALVVVFMSHGENENDKEFLCTYDSKVPTRSLWKPFLGTNCKTLEGKPKLFFIQACRGRKTDVGVGLKVSTDAVRRKTKPKPAVPVQPDVLVMWGSYEGLFSFRTSRGGINGSVFLHYLARALGDEGSKTSLTDLLLKVTRQVAINFESEAHGDLDCNKQMPQVSSTLLKNIVFTTPRSNQTPARPMEPGNIQSIVQDAI